MAGIYVNKDAVWKLPKSIWVNVSGTWKVCKNVYIKSSGGWREMIRSETLTSDKSNFNLWEHVGNPTAPLSLVFSIESGVEISSDDPVNRNNAPKRTPAFTVGNFPAGSTILISNNGYISGGGGFGGLGGFSEGTVNFLNGRNGSAGGDAITKGSSNNFDCTVTNTGTIASGGGGGGGAGADYYQGGQFDPSRYIAGGNGGDGAGITGYSKTQGGPSLPFQSNTATNGGNGGALATEGLPGENGNRSNPGGEGGEPGKAIVGGIEVAVSGNIIGVVS